MKNELMVIENVRCRTDVNGNPELNLEDVARGLGFIKKAKSGNKVVRWERIRSYLTELGVPTSGHDENIQLIGKDGLPDFIPENIFYKLCFKANNAIAMVFQDKVTDVILPQIRKTGGYIPIDKDDDDLVIMSKAFKIMQNTIVEKDKQIETMKPQAEYCIAVLDKSDLLTITDIAKDLALNGNELNILMKKNNVLFKDRSGTWHPRSNYNWLIKKGYADYHIYKNETAPPLLKWTEKGRKFIIDNFERWQDNI